MTESWIQVGDGNTVWAGDTGGDLPPILLLHPGVGNSRIWEPILPELRLERVPLSVARCSRS